MIVLTAATLFTPEESISEPLVFTEDGVISEITSRFNREIPANCRTLDYPHAVLAPAFVDIHVHGAAGHDVMESSPEALPQIEEFLARHGVGSYYPTTVTAPVPDTLASLSRLADAIEGSSETSLARARPAGIHLEGPFLSHARRGVHPPENLLLPSVEVFERFWQAARGQIKIITIAPELEGALELIAAATSRGVCVSLGHSDATLEITRTAADAGARHVTHLFNGMRPLHHRDPGIAGEALTNPNLSVEIIADGIHLDPAIVRLVLAAKSPSKVMLITDGTAATGMPDGRYRLGTFEFDVKNGTCLADGKLAGSTLTMDKAVRNIMQFAGYKLQQALPMATQSSRLEKGSKAEIVVLTPDGEIVETLRLRG